MPKRSIRIGGTAYTLDVRPDRLDLRDRPYQPLVVSLPQQYPSDANAKKFIQSYVNAGLVLDQGEEGACTGFGLAAVVNYLLWTRSLPASTRSKPKPFQSVSPYMLYDLARFYDEWPGQDYEGSSCRGAMKGWHKHGVCSQPLWQRSVNPAKPAPAGGAAKRKKATAPVLPPYLPDSAWPADAAKRPVGVYYRINRESVTDMQSAILDVGAIYVSCGVHAGWAIAATTSAKVSHKVLPRIPMCPRSEKDGGHAFAIVGFNEDGFVVQNSWGTDWGLNGFAVLRYADWVANGTDAWVCALGVPQKGLASASRSGNVYRPLGNASLLSGAKVLQAKPSSPAAQPWSEDYATSRCIVAGNDGLIEPKRPDLVRAQGYVNHIVLEGFEAWHARTNPATPRIALYFHGGLNTQDEAIERAQVMGPYFEANGIFPIFYVWKTGLKDTLFAQLQDNAQKNAPEQMASGWLGDQIDRAVEALAHGAGRWAWRQMKQNAEASAQGMGAAKLMVDALAALKAKHPALEVHGIAHSAGSFVMGHMLSLGLQLSSLHLYAAACPLGFALKHITPNMPAARTYLWMLEDAVEKSDFVQSKLLYRKSLLWLVSRGVEDQVKTPLAGFQRCVLASAKEPDDDLWASSFWPDVLAWRAQLGAIAARAVGHELINTSNKHRVDDQGKTIAGAHGGFDNDIDVINTTLKRVLNLPPNKALTQAAEDLNFSL